MALLTPEEVAQRRRMTVLALAMERHRKIGPRFIRDRRKIRYDEADLQMYLDSCRVETNGTGPAIHTATTAKPSARRAGNRTRRGSR